MKPDRVTSRISETTIQVSFEVLSIRSAFLEHPAKGESNEFTVFELEGQLDLVFMPGNGITFSLLVGESPCSYFRGTPKRGWCIVRRKVDPKVEQIAGPFRMLGGSPMGNRATGEPGKSLEKVRVELPLRVLSEKFVTRELLGTPGRKD